MSNDELVLWFKEKYNNCYRVTNLNYPYSVFLFYDESYIRRIKLLSIYNTSKCDIELPDSCGGYCLFQIHLTRKVIYCDYIRIWKILVDNLLSEEDVSNSTGVIIYNKIYNFIDKILINTEYNGYHIMIGSILPDNKFKNEFHYISDLQYNKKNITFIESSLLYLGCDYIK